METAKSQQTQILGLSTKGSKSNEENRLRTLLRRFDAELLPFDKKAKLRSLRSLLSQLRKSPRSLIVMEGTGIAGGIACLVGRGFLGHRYVISSGDAVGPFVASHSRLAGPCFALYERILCRFAAGFIGWTPYLVGRAMTFGCRRGVTAPGWVIGGNIEISSTARNELRSAWGVQPNDIVFGILGAIDWNARKNYCYGLELVKAIQQVERSDVKVVVIGDGSGLARLRSLAGAELGKRVLLPGRVPLEQVMTQLSAFDVASLPQSLDGVGAFRYTTKISEYQSAGLPIVTSQIPAAYDLPLPHVWRLPGNAPWEERYITAMAELMRNITADQLPEKQSFAGSLRGVFDEQEQVERVTTFLRDLLVELDS